MTWFHKHLGWTLVLGAVGITIILYIAAGISIDPYLTDVPYTFLAVLALAVIFSLWLEIWYLRRKARSLWFLLLNLLPNPLPLIILLSLPNKSYVEENEEDRDAAS